VDDKNKQNKPNKNALAIFALLFGATSWGLIWYPYRLMAEAGVSGIASSFYTYFVALMIAVIYFGFNCFKSGFKNGFKSGFKNNFKNELQKAFGSFTLSKTLIFLSLTAGWTNLGYVMAVIHGEVMHVMLLFYLSPLWTLILAYFWLKEPISRTGFFAIILSLIGAFTMLWQPNALPLPNTTSDWLAVSAGICFALTNVITRKSHHISLTTKSFAVWIGVVVTSLICKQFLGESFPSPSFFTATQSLVIVLIALLLIAVTLGVQYGVSQILASRAAVIFLFELVIAAVASYYWANEAMTANEWIGGCLIVAAGLVAATNE
jgi:drug/metabolite transporter (DMT)-like permease